MRVSQVISNGNPDTIVVMLLIWSDVKTLVTMLITYDLVYNRMTYEVIKRSLALLDKKRSSNAGLTI